MKKFKKENVFEILKTYDFNIENKIESDLLCLLCKRLLINAQISPCACRFCFDCISQYLNKEKKPCPGNADDCKIELLCLNDNIAVDHAINIRISKLNVKCPEKSCNLKCDLRNIEEHIRICNYRSACCPYLNIGCNSSNMHAGNLIDHLQLEIGNHTKLLIDCIDNLNNEIGRLKIIVDKLGEENKMLKCEINEIKLDGEKKQVKCDEQMREIDLLNKDMVALRNVDKYTRDDIDELKLDRERKEIEIDKLNKKLQEMELRFELERKSNFEKEIDKLKLSGERKQIELDKLNKKLQEIGKLKLDGERKEKELERKCAEQTGKIDLLNEEIVKLRNVDKCIREDVDKLKLDGERKEKELERKCAEQTGKIDLLNEEIVKSRNVDKCMREDLDKLKLDGERKQIEINKLNKKLEEIESIFEIESKSKIEKELDKLKLDGERKEKELERKCAEKTGKIDLLNEEIVKLRNVDKCTREYVDKLKLDGERKEKELEKKCAEKTSKIDLFYEEIVKMRYLGSCMIDHVDRLKLDGERNKKSIVTLEKKCEQQNKGQIEQFNKKYQEIEKKFVNANQERENKEKDLMRNEIDEMRNKQSEMRTMSNRIDQTMKNVENKLLEIEINQNKLNYGEFVWRIDKINDKMKDAKNGINKSIYSDSFYTHKHGYKMCLCVDPDGGASGKGTHLSVFFCLLKGEFDDILQWPFKYDVKFSLVNQQTRSDHVNSTAKYDDWPIIKSFNKPINERNDGFGRPKFIKLQELLTNANLILNNQIFIKCSVNIPS